MVLPIRLLLLQNSAHSMMAEVSVHHKRTVMLRQGEDRF